VTLEDVRATDDIDLIVDLAGFAEWAQLLELLRQKGFSEADGETVICRMRLGTLRVDFIPDDETILGFSNRWYAQGIETATIYPLVENFDIKILTPALFVATKLEAFAGRGNDDLLSSRDAEDILLVVDGREALLQELLAASESVRNYIAEQFTVLIALPDFNDFLEGNIRGPTGRVDIVRKRFIAISHCADDGPYAH
jgi:predicted nucleotidyltransferase